MRVYEEKLYTNTKEILAYPDHYVAIPVTHERATAEKAGLATLVDGQYIVKAGTVYPSNDAKAIGIVMHDTDVTRGDANLAIIVHGFIKKDKMPAPPSAEAITALKGVYFVPITAPEANPGV